MLARLNQYQDWALLILRLAIAGIFIYHGLLKWPIAAGTPPYMMIVAVAEPLGAIAILLGLLTRWAALGLGIIMIGAIWMKITAWGMTFAMAQGTGWEFDLMILAGCIVLLCFGAGKMSVDRAMNKA